MGKLTQCNNADDATYVMRAILYPSIKITLIRHEVQLVGNPSLHSPQGTSPTLSPNIISHRTTSRRNEKNTHLSRWSSHVSK